MSRAAITLGVVLLSRLLLLKSVHQPTWAEASSVHCCHLLLARQMRALGEERGVSAQCVHSVNCRLTRVQYIHCLCAGMRCAGHGSGLTIAWNVVVIHLLTNNAYCHLRLNNTHCPLLLGHKGLNPPKGYKHKSPSAGQCSGSVGIKEQSNLIS